MKKAVWLLVFLVCLSLASAQDYYNKASLDINLRLDSNIKIKPTATDYKITSIETKLFFFPRDDFQQEVLELKTSPTATEEDGYLRYTWTEPKETELAYWLEAKVKVFDNIYKVKEKIKFPLSNLPEEVLNYTGPSEIIDSDNPTIGQQASALAEGEDDLYAVAHKLATWVEENVNYDLGTLTADASQKASWVLENKKGVCDEMTSLIIAMCRSLGIPARFVSGVSYSNDLRFSEPWQAHGWAEVYFPDYGWIPFDAAFGEYGYVDPTHIKLSEAIDADEPTTRFSWLGKNVELEVSDLAIDAGILSLGEEREREVDLKIEVLESEVGFGSGNLVKVEIENLKNYYLAKTLYLYSTDEVEIKEEKRHILLKPGEKKTVYWILKLTSDLQANYAYTFPAAVKTEKNFSAKTEFYAKKGAEVFSESEITERLSSLTEEEEKELSKDVSISCVLERESIGLNEETGMECRVKNLGNMVLKSLEICLGEQCQRTDLNINEEKSFKGAVEGKEVGKQRFLVSVSSAEVSKSVYVDYAVLDKTEIKIKDIKYPEVVNYGEAFKIAFTLEKVSFASPKNVKVTLSHEGYPNEWVIQELSGDKNLVVDFSGGDLGLGENNFEIKAEWQDEAGQEETKENFTVKLGETNFGQKVIVFLKGIGRFLSKIFK